MRVDTMIVEIPSAISLTEPMPLSDAMRISASLNAMSEYAGVYEFGLRAETESLGPRDYRVIATVVRMRDLLVKSPKLQYQDV